MNQIQKHAFNILKRFRTYDISVDQLKTAISECGYTIVEYSKISNKPDVEILLKELNLKSFSTHVEAFTYADKNVRIVFVAEELSINEQIMVLSHEVGHILLGHMDSSPNIFGKNVIDENEANNFSSYLTNPGFAVKLRLFLMYNMKFIVSLCAIVSSVLLTLFSVYLVAVRYERIHALQTEKERRDKEQEYVYVTESGNKYHKKWCVYLENKTGLKKYGIDEINDLYTPCRVCFPAKFYETENE